MPQMLQNGIKGGRKNKNNNAEIAQSEMMSPSIAGSSLALQINQSYRQNPLFIKNMQMWQHIILDVQ